ncbi:hypothetical protein GGI23_002031 [Coemansia sp. RSA 2559]|nr:hypothetical protein GGI23_002031 [Coemansia sp. RSA 2559]KAJ2863369.1 hypothetical protein GGI22_001969 [Coemansia erecta]
MDSFTSSVSSQTVYLDGLDARCSIIRIAMCYWYENNAREPWITFMPPETLMRAFFRTLQEFPLLAGHLKADADSLMYVEVDKNNLNMPVYTDRLCDVDYSTMKESGFNIHKLPHNLSDEYGVPAPLGLVDMQIKQAYFRILRFRDESGILVFASIAHCLVDGYGFTRFMNRWAEISRWMQQPEDVGRSPLAVRQYVHDRSIHSSYHSNEMTVLDKLTLDSMSTGNAFTRWIAWISPEVRGWLFKAISGASDRTCCYFHIPLQTMEELRASVQKHAPPDTRYSINDVITAYITIVIAQTKKKASADWWSKPLPSFICSLFGNSSLSKPTDFLTSIAVNIRSRINHANAYDYMGTMVLEKSILFPQDMVHVEPNDEALSKLALSINQAIAATDERFVGQFGYLVNSKPDSYIRQTMCFAKQRNKLIISNQVRFAHYGVDFGGGMPDLARHAPHAFADILYVMPASPVTGGYEVEFNLATPVALNVIGNDSWMKLVDKCDTHL